MSDGTKLLKAESLRDLQLGISVSESEDLARLGLLEVHFRLALAEIARCVIVSGGSLIYGGHLHPDGYTSFLIRELERYSRSNQPLTSCLAWNVHRRMTLSQLRSEQAALGLLGRIVGLDPTGTPVDFANGRGEAVDGSIGEETIRVSLTGLRRYLANNAHARAFIGGKRSGFEGVMPGLMEEALYAFETGQPVYLVGGFGGITLDLARCLGLDDGKWMPDFQGAQERDERTKMALAQISDVAKKTNFQSFSNGLTDGENRQLAVCHRPSEIATLISLGLGRRFGN